MGGWVPKSSAVNPSFALINLPNGSTMQRWAVPFLTEAVGASADSNFSSALARARGLRVSSAPDASARYSRPRETAIARSWGINGARMTASSQDAKRLNTTGPPPPPSPARLSAGRPRAAEPHHVAHSVGDQEDAPDERRDDGHQPDVEVLDMAHLVGDDSLELFPIKSPDQPLGDRDVGMFGVLPRRERVGVGIRDDIKLGAGEAGGDGHFICDVLQHPVLLGVCRNREGVCAPEDSQSAPFQAVHGRHGAEEKRDEGRDREPEGGVAKQAERVDAKVKEVEPVTDETEKEDVERDDDNGGSAVPLLLLVNIGKILHLWRISTSSAKGPPSGLPVPPHARPGRAPPAGT